MTHLVLEVLHLLAERGVGSLMHPVTLHCVAEAVLSRGGCARFRRLALGLRGDHVKVNIHVRLGLGNFLAPLGAAKHLLGRLGLS